MKLQPELLPVAVYLLALVWFERRTSTRTGKPYLWCRFRVVHGEHAGREFYCGVAVDIAQHACAQRWSVWAEALSLDHAIELDDDAEIARSFLGRVFKSQVVHDKLDSGRTGNDLGHLSYARHYTAEDREIAKTWEAMFVRTAQGYVQGAGGWGVSA